MMLVAQPAAGGWSRCWSSLPLMMVLNRVDRQAHARRLPPAAGQPGRAQRPHRGDASPAQRVVKAYAQEQTAIDEFDVANQRFATGGHTRPDLCRLHGPVMDFVNNISLAIVAGAGRLDGACTAWPPWAPSPPLSTTARQFGAPAEPDRQSVQHDPVGASPAPSASSRSSTRCPSWSTRRTPRRWADVEGEVVFDACELRLRARTCRCSKNVSSARRARARRSRWWGRPAPARRRSSTCSPASTISTRVASCIDGHDIRAGDSRTICAGSWASCCRTPSSSPTP